MLTITPTDPSSSSLIPSNLLDPMMFARKNRTIVSIVAMALAAMSSQVDASIYQAAGRGFCEPDNGELYSYLLKVGDIQTFSRCSEECDTANFDLSEQTRASYRGFNHIRARFTSDIMNIPGHSCMCLYDHQSLPEELPDHLQPVWTLNGNGEGHGIISQSDDTAGIGCYEVLVEKAVSKHPMLLCVSVDQCYVSCSSHKTALSCHL